MYWLPAIMEHQRGFVIAVMVDVIGAIGGKLGAEKAYPNASVCTPKKMLFWKQAVNVSMMQTLFYIAIRGMAPWFSGDSPC